jgi:hypothetical protein
MPVRQVPTVCSPVVTWTIEAIGGKMIVCQALVSIRGLLRVGADRHFGISCRAVAETGRQFAPLTEARRVQQLYGSSDQEERARVSAICTLRQSSRPLEEYALNDLSKETRLRRQRAHDVASVLGSLHMDGLDVDPEAYAMAQRYVDGKISLAQVQAAVRASIGCSHINASD